MKLGATLYGNNKQGLRVSGKGLLLHLAERRNTTLAHRARGAVGNDVSGTKKVVYKFCTKMQTFCREPVLLAVVITKCLSCMYVSANRIQTAHGIHSTANGGCLRVEWPHPGRLPAIWQTATPLPENGGSAASLYVCLSVCRSVTALAFCFQDNAQTSRLHVLTV